MKGTWPYWLAFAAALVVIGCGGGKSNQPLTGTSGGGTTTTGGGTTSTGGSTTTTGGGTITTGGGTTTTGGSTGGGPQGLTEGMRFNFEDIILEMRFLTPLGPAVYFVSDDGRTAYGDKLHIKSKPSTPYKWVDSTIGEPFGFAPGYPDMAVQLSEATPDLNTVIGYIHVKENPASADIVLFSYNGTSYTVLPEVYVEGGPHEWNGGPFFRWLGTDGLLAAGNYGWDTAIVWDLTTGKLTTGLPSDVLPVEATMRWKWGNPQNLIPDAIWDRSNGYRRLPVIPESVLSNGGVHGISSNGDWIVGWNMVEGALKEGSYKTGVIWDKDRTPFAIDFSLNQVPHAVSGDGNVALTLRPDETPGPWAGIWIRDRGFAILMDGTAGMSYRMTAVSNNGKWLAGDYTLAGEHTHPVIIRIR